MKISIITVCYNSESTIAHTIRSVVSQTYQDIEHIIIDGLSLDKTLAIIKNEAIHNFKLISEIDSGIYDAMNKGIKISTGNVIAFLNADDYYSNNTVIENVMNLIIDNNLDALYGNVNFFNSNNNNLIVRKYNSRYFHPDKLKYGWMPAHPSLFLSKDLFTKFGLFNTDYKIAADFDFIIRIFYNNNTIKFYYYPHTLVSMQLGGVSTSGLRSTLILNIEMYNACKKNGVPTNWVKLLSRYPYKLLEYL
jgi:glycosyltransferase involved in cell wall biosynthesis